MKKPTERWYIRFLIWQREHLNVRHLVILVSIVVGIAGGLAAVLLKTFIHAVESSIHEFFPEVLFLIIPLAGIVMVSAINQLLFTKTAPYKGIGQVIVSIARKSSFISTVLTYSRMLTSGLTMGMGGSAGLESPIVVTGSAIGSNIARFFRLEPKYRTLFIGCGTAAGISAIFNAPITGVIFALEVIIPQFSSTIFIPVLISAATGNLVSHLLFRHEGVLQVAGVAPFASNELILVVILGLLAGIGSVYFDFISKITDQWLSAIKQWWTRALIGGLGLGILLYFFPIFYGEGYFNIRYILDDRIREMMQQSIFNNVMVGDELTIVFFLLLFIGKPLAASLTLHSGGDGGMFAPSFITGGFLGYLFYLLLEYFYPALTINPVNYTLYGMSGMLAGVMHSPLTAIFIIAEMTGGYQLFIPLMLISAIAYFFKLQWDQTPVYFNTPEFLRLIQLHKESMPINQIKLNQLVEKDFVPLNVRDTLRDALQAVTESHRNIFPVLTEDRELAGIILLDDLRPIMFDEDKYDTTYIQDMMHLPPERIDMDDSMTDVLHKFERSEAWNLPVLRNGKYVGFLSKSSLFSAYRDELRHSSDVF